MTGFTRFLYEHDSQAGNSKYDWFYSKTENMPLEDYSLYTHLLTDKKSYPGFVPYKEPFKQFARLDPIGFLKAPFKNPLVILEDKVYLLEREDVHKIRISGASVSANPTSGK